MRIVRPLDYPPAASAPPFRAFSSGGGREALIREQEVIEIYFRPGRAAKRSEIELA